ncbi:hypothetical protein B0H14DRAFT_3876285 [Mycena olivaceomarginata]|nr:hypothetical protein B0H14DRAFT_3876285 [Mycena olivaceomarginata]
MANSKLGHAVHPKQAHDTDAAHGGVLASILKQYPNLSVFHHTPAQQPSPSPSPTKSRHMNMFTKAYDYMYFCVSSHDRLSPSVDALRSLEPSRAPLRAEDSPLKDPATGTRQDGRFFSCDTYKVLSLDTPHQFAMTHAFNTPIAPPDDAQTFLERLQSNASSSSMLSFASSVTPKLERYFAAPPPPDTYGPKRKKARRLHYPGWVISSVNNFLQKMHCLRGPQFSSSFKAVSLSPAFWES